MLGVVLPRPTPPKGKTGGHPQTRGLAAPSDQHPILAGLRPNGSDVTTAAYVCSNHTYARIDQRGRLPV
jgi:hypothetical protein